MSDLPYTGQASRDEHDSAVPETKKVSMYGWDTETTPPRKVKLIVRPDGTIAPSDYFVEVAAGNINGDSGLLIAGRNPSVGTAFEDLWDDDGDYDYPASAESWELVSTSTNDASGGTGARVIIVNSLDSDWSEQTQVVVPTGTTPVNLTGTHIRASDATTITGGSVGANDGDITIRPQGGGNTRMKIIAGMANTFMGIRSVPAGKIFVGTQISGFIPKNEDIIIRTQARLFGTNNTFFNTSQLAIYQGSFVIPLKAGTSIPAKSDIKIRIKSTNPSVEVFAAIEGVLRDT